MFCETINKAAMKQSKINIILKGNNLELLYLWKQSLKLTKLKSKSGENVSHHKELFMVTQSFFLMRF